MLKFSVFDLYMKLILLMPITTLFQRFIDPINRMLFMIIFVLQFLLIAKKINKIFLFFLLITFSGFIISTTNSSLTLFDNMIVYYINWILFTAILISYRDKFINWIKSNKCYMSYIIILWVVTVIISIPFPISYYIKEGGERYFGSFTGTVFRLAPTALMIQTLCIIMITYFKEKKYFIYMLIPLYCAFSGSSRTYLFILLLQFFMAVYMVTKNKLKLIFIFIFLSLLLVVILYNSSMFQKFLYTFDSSNYGDFWFRITSSRSLIWEQILYGFNKYDIYNKIFGGGFKASFSLNTNNVYSHNDFIEILVTFGYVGLISYLATFYNIFKKYFKENRVSVAFYVFCFFIWSFNAMFNQFYNYTCACFAFPFLLVSILLYQEDKKNSV